jgi:hypothetical protein
LGVTLPLPLPNIRNRSSRHYARQPDVVDEEKIVQGKRESDLLEHRRQVTRQIVYCDVFVECLAPSSPGRWIRAPSRFLKHRLALLTKQTG